MRAGRLRHRLVLQSQTETRDAHGAAVIAFTTEATVWGGIEPLSGREYFAQQQIQNEVSVRIVIRFYSGLDESWRVVNNGKVYSILSVINENERDRMMTLMCSKGVKETGGLPTE
jgi:SPP1 family predicted phage head-tail adaptor